MRFVKSLLWPAVTFLSILALALVVLSSLAFAQSSVPIATITTIKGGSVFGFIPGGNNNAAWANFYAYLNGLNGGNCYRIELDLAPGVYYSDTITIPSVTANCVNGGVIVNGAGMKNTILTPNTTSNPIFFKANGVGNTQNLQLRNLSIIGIGATNAGQHGLYWNATPQTTTPYNGGIWYSVIESVQIDNFDGINFVDKGGSQNNLTPNQNTSFKDFFIERYAGNQNPTALIMGQVGQLTWINGDVSAANENNNLGPNLWMAQDPRRNVTVTSATTVNPGVLTLGTNQGWYNDGQKVMVVGTSLPSALAYSTAYWITKEVTSTGSQTIELASSAANAGTGTGINFTGCSSCASPTWSLVPAEMMPTAVNTTTGAITTSGAHLLTGQDIVQVYGANLPTGLSLATNYYVTVLADNSIALSSSLANQQAGTYVVPSTAGTLGNWGLAPASLTTASSPYSIVLENVTSQNSEWAFCTDMGGDYMFIEPHLEVDLNGLRVRNGATVNWVGGHMANVGGSGAGTYFETANFGDTVNVVGSVNVLGTYNNFVTNYDTNGPGLFITPILSNNVGSTTGSGITAPWNTYEETELSPASSLTIGRASEILLNAGATAISYINSQQLPGSLVTMRVFTGTGNTVTFNNSGNIYLGGNTSETYPVGTVLTFRLHDLADTWVLVNASSPVSRLIGQTFTISGLPSCGTTIAGARTTISNGVASPTYLGTVSTTGSATDSVFCNGSAWVYD